MVIYRVHVESTDFFLAWTFSVGTSSFLIIYLCSQNLRCCQKQGLVWQTLKERKPKEKPERSNSRKPEDWLLYRNAGNFELLASSKPSLHCTNHYNPLSYFTFNYFKFTRNTFKQELLILIEINFISFSNSYYHFAKLLSKAWNNGLCVAGQDDLWTSF